MKPKKFQGISTALEQLVTQARKKASALETTQEGDFFKIPKDFDGIHWIKNTQGKEFLILSLENIQTIISATKAFEKEKFLFRLEQEIAREMPIDFDDVWCIALNECQKSPQKEPKEIVKKIKKAYPYLFMELNTLINSIKSQ